MGTIRSMEEWEQCDHCLESVEVEAALLLVNEPLHGIIRGVHIYIYPMKVAWEWSMKVVSSWKACASNTFIHVGCIVWRQFPTNFKKIGVFLQNTPLYSAGCGGCWFTVRERYSWLACVRCWFGVREKYCCWLPAEQSGRRSGHQYTVSFWWGAW